LYSLYLFRPAFDTITYTDLILGLLTIFISYGFNRIPKAIPSTLVALLVVSIGAYLLIPEYRKIGVIPEGFPILNFEIFGGFKLRLITPYIVTAASLPPLGAIGSLL